MNNKSEWLNVLLGGVISGYINLLSFFRLRDGDSNFIYANVPGVN